MQQLRLLTIPMSHYCEKARWGLERLGLAYREERHLQLFHYPYSYRLSGGPNVPVLCDHGQVVADSTRILQHLDRYAEPQQRLYPEDPTARREVEAWEERFDEELGVDARRWVYHHFLPHPVAALRTAGQGVPRWEILLAPLSLPFMLLLMSVLLRPSVKRVAAGLDRSRTLVAQLDRLLADGRRYLVGDRFSAADLALASLMAPYVLPEQYGIRLPRLDEVPAAMAKTVAEFRATRTGRYVLDLYATQR